MHPSRTEDGRPSRQDPLEGETHVWVLDHSSSGSVHGITEAGLYLVRLRIPSERSSLSPSDKVSISGDDADAMVLGMTRHRDLSGGAQSELTEVLSKIINDNPEKTLSFFNKASNLTLKKHAFTLMPRIGDSKAMSMVELRGRQGWETLTAIDESCGIETANLMAERLTLEIADRHMTPRLLDLLFRV